MNLRMLILLITAGLSAQDPSIRNPRNANQPESGDDIQFDVADITTQLDYPTTTVTLEAFRVRNRTRTDAPKWVSIGYPMIVKDRNGQIFQFTPEQITVKIAVLDALQKQTLFQTAKDEYPNENAKIGNIIPLPLVQFTCRMIFYANGSRYEFQGSVYNLRRSPFSLEFPVHEGSSKREALEIRLRSNHPLILKCELAATGKQEKVNTLRITSEQLQSMDLTDKLLGPSDEKFVTRKQLQQLSQEIRTNLRIEQEYEIENEEFNEEFMYKILENSRARFEPLPIDEALAQLSMYGIRSSDRDLSPNEMKRELSDMLHVSIEGNKSHIVAGRNQNVNSSTHAEGSQGRRGGAVRDMASADIIYIMKNSDTWKKDDSTLDDQLYEINRYSQSGIKWEREGLRIIPKSLDVAKVTKMSLRQQMSFTRMKKKITSEKYYRRYDLSTADTETARESTDPIMQRVMALEQSLQGNISLVKSQVNIVRDDFDVKLISAKDALASEFGTNISNIIMSLTSDMDTNVGNAKAYIASDIVNRISSVTRAITSDLDNKIVNATSTIISEIDNKISNVKSTVNSDLGSKISNFTAVTCVTKETTTNLSSPRVTPKVKQDKGIAIQRIDCWSNHEYRTAIYWKGWKDRGDKLSLWSEFRCCDRLTGSCQNKNNAIEPDSSEALYLSFTSQHLALDHLDCGDDEWYINNIYWQKWELQTVNGAETHFLKSRYRCCKRGP